VKVNTDINSLVEEFIVLSKQAEFIQEFVSNELKIILQTLIESMCESVL